MSSLYLVKWRLARIDENRQSVVVVVTGVFVLMMNLNIKDVFRVTATLRHEEVPRFVWYSFRFDLCVDAAQ